MFGAGQWREDPGGTDRWSVLVWGVPGLAWSLIAGLVVSFLAFPGYFAAPDPYDSTSELDHRDGVGIGAR